jgi:hypothetical protein
VGGGIHDPKSYVLVKASNVGDRPTTITNLGGMRFDTWWHAYISRRKPGTAFVVNEPSQVQRIPYRFEVGDQWMGMVEQTDDLVRDARQGYLFMILYTSNVGKGHRVRLLVPKKNVTP